MPTCPNILPQLWQYSNEVWFKGKDCFPSCSQIPKRIGSISRGSLGFSENPCEGAFKIPCIAPTDLEANATFLKNLSKAYWRKKNTGKKNNLLKQGRGGSTQRDLPEKLEVVPPSSNWCLCGMLNKHKSYMALGLKCCFIFVLAKDNQGPWPTKTTVAKSCHKWWVRDPRPRMCHILPIQLGFCLQIPTLWKVVTRNLDHLK